jgi:hypothetical protein
MSTFTTSRGTRGQHVQPKVTVRSSHLTPAHREYVYGKVQPMDDSPYRSPSRIDLLVMLAVMLLIGMLIATGGNPQ